MGNCGKPEKVLFVFDHGLKTGDLSRFIPMHGEVDIFPLTGDWSLVDSVENSFKNVSGSNTQLINTARLVNEQLGGLRQRLIKWSKTVGELQIDNKALKEILLLPGKEVSTWWFGLISEKNPYNTDLFLQLAQISAVNAQLSMAPYDSLFVAVRARKLRRVVSKIAEDAKIKIQVLPTNLFLKNGKRFSFKKLVGNTGKIGGISLSLASLIRFYGRSILTRLAMGNKEKRRVKNSLLFATYFPYVDEEAAGKNRFKNELVLRLQEKIEQNGKPLAWLLMITAKDGWPWSKSLKLARRFGKAGENVFVLEEFLDFKTMLKSLILWIGHIRKCLKIENKIDVEDLATKLAVPSSAPLVLSLLEKSFYDPSVMKGIVCLEMFKNVFDEMGSTKDCIYFCEFQEWEKALNAALKKTGKCGRSIGFQHTSVSRNLFRFFYTPEEIASRNRPADLPLPDVIACNGEGSFNLLKESGFSNLRRVEAVRQLYLNHFLDQTSHSEKQREVFLVACPMNRQEARVLISLVNTAFSGSDRGFKICFKGHPYTPLKGIFKELGIQYREKGFVIKHGSINECLPSAFAVLVSSSTIAIEALASGCEVLVPFFSESISINPINDFQEYYRSIYSPRELRENIHDLWIKKRSGMAENGKRDFVRHYWNLDPSLVQWEKLLFATEGQGINVDEASCSKQILQHQ